MQSVTVATRPIEKLRAKFTEKPQQNKPKGTIISGKKIMKGFENRLKINRTEPSQNRLVGIPH